MLEIDLSHYNEMLKYEKDMDCLRALTIWITNYDGKSVIPGLSQPKEYVFDLIKHFSIKFATDILDHNSISSGTMDLFHSSIFSTFKIFSITQEDVVSASAQQRYKNSGFWEMRRCLGQMGEIAKCASSDGVTHVITAAVSGCIIGEYLGTLMPSKVPVDHMIFSRCGTDPTAGHLPENFELKGNHVLLVDDAVMGTVTSQIMINELKKINPDMEISIFSVDVDPDTMESGYLNQFSHVYLPEE